MCLRIEIYVELELPIKVENSSNDSIGNSNNMRKSHLT